MKRNDKSIEITGKHWNGQQRRKFQLKRCAQFSRNSWNSRRNSALRRICRKSRQWQPIMLKKKSECTSDVDTVDVFYIEYNQDTVFVYNLLQ